MQSNGDRRRFKSLVLGLAVLFVPALIIVATLEFLILTGDLVLSDLSLIELVELYLIDLVLFAGGAYLLYRLLLYYVPDFVAEVAGEPTDEESTDRAQE